MVDDDQFAQVSKMAEIGLMTASLSHEMRQPLFAIKSYAQLLMMDRRNVGDERLRHLLSAVELLEEMINPLVDFSRQNRGESVAFDLGDAARAAVKLLQFRLRKHGVHLHESYEGGLPRVFAHPQKLQQVFINLLQNSLDATEKRNPRHLFLHIRRGAGDTVEALVGDNGSGISQSDATRIFEIFFTTKAEGKGTGLGLWIASDIVRAAGGQIELMDPPVIPGVDPAPATLFKITMPAVRRMDSGSSSPVSTY